ncbi:MAG: LysR family transcriptional regulator [Gammaproteobacteria bacterium]|nr:LysR family transcriptional regulator [Gammaproteobacteria bacterium]
MDWDDFKYFTAVAHAESVRKAAEQLGVHASTVTRRLDQFERRLGVRLFTRTHSGLLITPEGAEVIEQVDEVAAELEAIQQRLQYRHGEMAGRLRITIADVLLDNLLIHDFAAFTGRYPEIQLEFIPAHQNPDLDRHEVDLVVSVTDNPPDHLVGRRLGMLAATVFCSRRYLGEHDPRANPEDCHWIETDLGTGEIPGAGGAGTSASTDVVASMGPHGDPATHDSQKTRYFATMPDGARVSGLILQLAAIRGGMGIGLLPCVLGDSDPELVRLAGMGAFEMQDVWMFIHPDLRNLSRVQALMEFLQQTFRDHPRRLLGETQNSTNTDMT